MRSRHTSVAVVVVRHFAGCFAGTWFDLRLSVCVVSEEWDVRCPTVSRDCCSYKTWELLLPTWHSHGNFPRSPAIETAATDVMGSPLLRARNSHVDIRAHAFGLRIGLSAHSKQASQASGAGCSSFQIPLGLTPADRANGWQATQASYAGRLQRGTSGAQVCPCCADPKHSNGRREGKLGSWTSPRHIGVTYRARDAKSLTSHSIS